jgi:hypothetical protein
LWELDKKEDAPVQVEPEVITKIIREKEVVHIETHHHHIVQQQVYI